MPLRTDPAQVVRFSVFELDLRSGELRKGGVRVPLQDQPLEILKALLERPGDLVTRDQLRQRLWRDDTFVDFEDGLNGAIRRLRDALGDNATTPRFVETLPRRGYRFIAPLAAEPTASAVVGSPEPAPARAASPSRLPGRQVWHAALTAVLIVAVAILMWREFRTSAPVPQPSLRLSVKIPPLAVLVHAQSPAVALSPDGTRLAYVSGDSERGQLYVRNLNSGEVTAIPGAEQVQGPFFSPDGQWIAFFGRGDLQKIFLGGGNPTKICAVPLPNAHGGSWGDDGTIVFENGTQLWRVPANGGVAARIAADGYFLWPQMLPDSRTVLLTGGIGSEGIWLLSLEGGRLRQILPERGIARYVRSGHLVYASQGSLLAARFDLGKLQLTGQGTPVAQQAMMGFSNEEKIAHFAVSETGTLAYLPGPLLKGAGRILVWVDREGREEIPPVEPRGYHWPRVSPDGSRVAVYIAEWDEKLARNTADVWIYDLARRTRTKLTSDPASDERPLWTPDGTRVLFRSYRDGGGFNLFWTLANGTGRAERVTTQPNPDRAATSFSPDGKKLLVTERAEEGDIDIHMLLLNGQQRSQPLLHERYQEGSPALSPDGRWVAYRSNETGPYEIYVRPFPEVDQDKVTVSTTGGNAPLWSPDGRELFFDSGEAMMAAPVQTTGSRFAVGTPKALFTITGKYFADGARNRHFDVSRDGRRFIMLKEIGDTIEASARDELTIVLNWFEALRERAKPTAIGAVSAR